MNKATISGTILETPFLVDKKKGEKFFETKISAKRNSGNKDIITILLPEALLPTKTGDEVLIEGTYRSRMDNNKLKHYVLASMMLNSETEGNLVELSGVICKEPVYRTTPLGREITDLFIAVNFHHRRNSYITCIAWGRNAQYASVLTVGDKVKLTGRIQSREYEKEGIVHRINEVSIQTILREHTDETESNRKCINSDSSTDSAVLLDN